MTFDTATLIVFDPVSSFPLFLFLSAWLALPPSSFYCCMYIHYPHPQPHFLQSFPICLLSEYYLSLVYLWLSFSNALSTPFFQCQHHCLVVVSVFTQLCPVTFLLFLAQNCQLVCPVLPPILSSFSLQGSLSLPSSASVFSVSSSAPHVILLSICMLGLCFGCTKHNG